MSTTVLPITQSHNATLQALKKRKAQDDDLLNVEKQIFDLEEAYIEETMLYGNIIRGWSEYVTYRPKPNVKKTKVSNRDRIFTFSSVSAASLASTNKTANDDDDDEDNVPKRKH